MPLSPGDHVDRYEVLAPIGSGGMGDVYQAKDPKLGRLVALKVLRADPKLGTEGGARLLREARAVASLSHPNVVNVFDAGEVQEPEEMRGLTYIAMELVIGNPLGRFIGDAKVPMERRIGWMRDVALALGAAHAAGIVHRDVKPENVLVRADGVVKVLDFGIARKMTAETWEAQGGYSLPTLDKHQAEPMLTEPGSLVGTPYYMAPEQLRGEPLDGRADQFSWGVLAYAVLCGKPPWKGGTESFVVVSQILTMNPPAPHAVDPAIPPVVSDVIERALSKERDRRFDSMEQLVRALDGLGADQVAEAEEEERAGSRSRALRWGAGALVVTAAASAMALARKPPVANVEAPSPVTTTKARDAAAELSILGMVRLPGGTFTMGSSVAELDAECVRLGKRCARQTLDREQPPREVHVSPFFLDVNETTNREFVEWLKVERLTVRPDSETKAPRYIYDQSDKIFLVDVNAEAAYPGIRIREDQAIETVPGAEERAATRMTWDAANAYCLGRGKRLPTEAEYEFAAAGTTRRRFPWGDEEPSCEGVVYGRDQHECVGMPKGPQPVTAGGQDWTPEGIHDLGGNVVEWVQDAFAQPFYPDCGECVDPVSKPAPGATKDYRLLRGGSWASTVNLVRAGSRSPWERSSAATSAGIRCAMSAAK